MMDDPVNLNDMAASIAALQNSLMVVMDRLAAMREPPPKCLAALCVWAELSGNKLALEKDALLIWQDVFDQALEEDHAEGRETRRAGHSRLVYDKEKRTIVTETEITPAMIEAGEPNQETAMSDINLDALLDALQRPEDDPEWVTMNTQEKTVVVKIAKLARLAQQEIERLKALLTEAADELAFAYHDQYPNRADYPDEMRRYTRDMKLVNRIRETT